MPTLNSLEDAAQQQNLSNRAIEKIGGVATSAVTGLSTKAEIDSVTAAKLAADQAALSAISAREDATQALSAASAASAQAQLLSVNYEDMMRRILATGDVPVVVTDPATGGTITPVPTDPTAPVTPPIETPITVTPAASASYAATVNSLSPALYIPFQDEWGSTIKTAAGETLAPRNGFYSDDSWNFVKPFPALGKFAISTLIAGVADVSIPLDPVLAKVAALAKSNTWTISGWAYVDHTAYKQTLFSIWGGSTLHMSLHVADNGMGVRFEDSANSVNGPTASTIVGGWHHIGAAINNGAVSLYVDGIKVGSGAIAKWTADVTASFLFSYLGTGSMGNCTYGGFTQWSLHSKTLADTDMAKLFSDGTADVFEQAWYGKSPNYGTNAGYFTSPYEAVLRDPSVPLVANWFGALPTNSAELVAEGKSSRFASHANPWATLSAFTSAGLTPWPDYENMVDSVAQREADARTIAWGSKQDPTKLFDDRVANKLMPPLWQISDEWDMGDLFDSEKSTWIDKLAKFNSDMSTYLPSGMRAFVNEGTGTTMGHRTRQSERAFFKHPALALTSADFYTACVNKAIATEAFNHGYPSADPAVIRRPIFYAYVVERLRGVIDRPMPLLNAIGLSHANQPSTAGDWASVPTPSEVEAAVIAGFIGGAAGVLWFPQSFEHDNDKKTLLWSSTTAYRYGDQVRLDTDGLTTYWSCVAASAAGINPSTDAPNVRWVRWRFTQRCLASDPVGHAIGMPDAVQRSYALIKAKAKVIQSNSKRRARVNPKLEALLVENVDGKNHLLVMQRWDQVSGSYALRLPASAAGKTITVEHQTGTSATATRTASVNDATFSETFKDPASFYWYSWDADGTTSQPISATTPTAQPWSVNLIGDSMVAPDSQNITPAQIAAMFKAAGATTAQVYGVDGKQMLAPDSKGKTTLQNIDDMVAAGPLPTVWAISLCQNPGSDDAEALRLKVRQIIAKIRSIQPGAKIAWAGWCTGYAIEGYYTWGQTSSKEALIQRMIEQEMAALGASGHHIDVWGWLRDNLIDAQKQPTGIARTWYPWATDQTHPTVEGCRQKYNFVTADLKAFATS